MSDRALVIAQKALAGLMAEAGFAVPSKNRDEQWDAPIEDAASILGTMLALDLIVLPTPESRADPDPTGQNSYGPAASPVPAPTLDVDAQLLAMAMDIAMDRPIFNTGLRRVDVVIREYARLAAASRVKSMKAASTGASGRSTNVAKPSGRSSVSVVPVDRA